MSSERSEVRMPKVFAGVRSTEQTAFNQRGSKRPGQGASLIADRPGHLADGSDEQRAKRGANAEGVCGSAKHGANGFQPKGKQAAGAGSKPACGQARTFGKWKTNKRE